MRPVACAAGRFFIAQLSGATPRHCSDSERLPYGPLLLALAVPFDERSEQRCSSFVRRVKIASPAGYLGPLGEGIRLARNGSRYTYTNLLLCDGSLQQEEKYKVDKYV